DVAERRVERFEGIDAVFAKPALDVVVVKLLRPQHPGKRLPHDVGAVGAQRRRNDRLVELVRLSLALRDRCVEVWPEWLIVWRARPGGPRSCRTESKPHDSC